MEVACTHEDGYALAVCEGPLDESAQLAFRDALHPLFAQRGTLVVADLSGSNWINSEGIAAMVRLVADANKNGCRVVFAAPNAFVQEVLQVTRLVKYFDVAPTRAEALNLLDADADSP